MKRSPVQWIRLARLRAGGFLASLLLLSGPLAAQTSPPVPTRTARSAGAISPFPNGDFEAAEIAAYQYRPVWQDWTMSGGAGIAKNGSAFTSSNPPAPSGVYVTFLQTGATMSRSHTFTAGVWRLRFQAAQRMVKGTPNRQVCRITVGDVKVAEEQPISGNYAEFTTRPFTVPAGARTVTISTFNPYGGDNTVFIDNIRLEPVALWNSTNTWGAAVPTAADNVFIPAGVEVALTGTCSAATVNVAGELLVTNANASLSTRWLLVSGLSSAFEVGTPRCPFEQSFTLELTGDNTTEDVMGAGSKFLMAMDGAFVDLHGLPQVSWTHLSATVPAGATQITLAEPVTWNVNDWIVIAPSGFNSDQAEKRRIIGRSADGKTLTLDSGLTYRHLGVTATHTRSTDNRAWTVDQRAEVGLLSHNVRVQGDAGSETDGFGGHVMFMCCSSADTTCDGPGYARISGVEFYRMGQKQRLRRYPIHWHMEGDDAAGQFLRSSSIHYSFNRAVTIHGSNSVSVEDNVAYDHIGHGIFLEDGSERFNHINRNLALVTRRPPDGEELLDSDNQFDTPQNRSPATFWITNPNNEMTGNVAAGTAGTGYWFAFPASPLGLSASDSRFSGLQPYKEPLGAFSGNVAHSCGSGFDTNDSLNPDGTLRTNVSWDPPAPESLENLTFYANQVAIYAGVGNDKTLYRNVVMADNSNPLFLAAPQTVSDSLLVADSGNAILGAAGPHYGYAIYDGPGRLFDSHLVGFNLSNANLFNVIGGATRHANHLFRGLTCNHTGKPRVAFPDYTGGNSYTDPRIWGFVLRDVDGSLGGIASSSVICNHPMARTANDTTLSNWTNAWISRHRFALLRVAYPGSPLPDATITREGGGQLAVAFLNNFKVDAAHQLPVIVDSDFTYEYSLSALPSGRQILVRIDDAAAGDVAMVRFDNLGVRSGLAVSGCTRYTSLTGLKAGTTSGYFVESNGRLWIRIVSAGGASAVTVTWSS